MSPSLLQSCSYAAEKSLKKNKAFNRVIYVTVDAAGKKLFYENVCGHVPASISDREILSSLAEKMHDDFTAAGVTKFAIAYSGSKVRKLHRLEPPTEDVMLTTSGVVIEEHDNNGLHVRGFCEILERPGAKPILAAMTPPEAIDEGIYMNVISEDSRTRAALLMLSPGAHSHSPATVPVRRWTASNSRQAPWPVVFLAGATGTCFAGAQAVAFPGRSRRRETVPLRRWTANITAERRQLVIVLCQRGRHLFGAAMMQNLDLVDWILLAGSLIYFGLVMLRRI